MSEQPTPPPSAMVPSGFDKSQRLLTAADYQPVFDRAVFKVSTPELLLLATPSDRPAARLGLVIGRKHARRAVDRNRVKRISREQFRHVAATLPPVDIIVLGRKGVANLDHATLHRQLQQLFQQLAAKAERRIQQDSPA
ncbi:MAG TPA: ribonuclease P protein component [Spongiibacteraceae bacterium]|nr:ribonuclease P protein component [Spongiibacteraceae bacterium]HUH37238.1 ribonuclease P protein component [Spongiibacteraceae bacterium]